MPTVYRNEVLAFLARGSTTSASSRSPARARGWGLPVPDDPSQVIYVWWDALGNYVTALDYGTDGDAYRHWWCDADERVHVIGKGILRFHAVYWPAILLSAGEPLPTKICVHPYLTAGGEKLSKSAGNAVDPVQCRRRGGARRAALVVRARRAPHGRRRLHRRAASPPAPTRTSRTASATSSIAS